METAIYSRFFDPYNAFLHPESLWMSVAIVLTLVVAWILVYVLGRSGNFSDALRKELNLRIRSWAIMIPCILLPILMGAAWVMLGILVLSISCYREYARATGLFRNSWTSFWVVVGILCINVAVIDHWYGFFVALPSLGVIVLAAMAMFFAGPSGYLQRVALAVLGYLLFGVCLGHLGYIANDADYRPVMILLFLCVEINDVFAYIFGKLFGRIKLAPEISPNKTVGGALGALIGTVTLLLSVGLFVFEGTPMGSFPHLICLGGIVSVGGQMGDLMLSSIKRDIGIKDIGNTIPGHGGFLDRFDSILLVAPGFFHYVHSVNGFGLKDPARIFF